MFKIRAGYYLELLTPETMKLLESNKKKITKDKIRENLPHLKITELVLIHFNIDNKSYQRESCIHLFLINCLLNY